MHPADPAAEPVETLRDYYRQMALIRRFELRAAEMYQRAKIGGYCHLNLGEEATVVGLMAALEPRDYLFTTYREHGYALARGHRAGPGHGRAVRQDDRRVAAAGAGRCTCSTARRACSAATASSAARFRRRPAPRWRSTYRGGPGPDAEAVMCLLGDATTNIGAFHESLNLAALWQLPIVYVIVNNQLGMGTPVEAAAAEPDLYKRGCAYRIPGERVDGNDVLAVRDAAREAAATRARTERQPEAARGGQLPAARATRWSTRPGTAPREETERVRGLDPLPAFRGPADRRPASSTTRRRRGIDEEVERAGRRRRRVRRRQPRPDVPTSCSTHAYATPVANAPHRAARRPGHFHARRTRHDRDHLPAGAARHAARRTAARRVGVADRRGDRRVRGLLQDHRRAAGRVRADRVRGHPDRRGGIRRRRDRRRDARPAAGRGDHDDQLQPAGASTRSSTTPPRCTPCSAARSACRW